MIRLKKKLNEEEMVWLLDELKGRIDGEVISEKYSKVLITKLNEFAKVAEMAKPKLKPKKVKKPVGVVKRVHEDKDAGRVEPMDGEVIFTTLRDLIEMVKPQFDAGIQFRQYTNPISQLMGYATDDGNKYVINIVDLRKDPRADSFTFNPIRLLEEGNE